MNFENVFSRLRQKLLLAAANKAAVRPTNKAHLKVESLESREVPATLPAPVIDYTTTRSVTNNALAPTIAQDPLNPNWLFGAVVTQSGASTSIQVIYSNNAGVSWVNGETLVKSNNSETPDTAFLNVSNPSIAFDRFHNVYLTYIERSSNSSAGQIVLQKFNFNGIPTQIDANGAQPGLKRVIYQWRGNDQAFNPTVGVNSNLATFTDPTTGETQTDPTAATQTSEDTVKVWVAWNTNDVAPNGASASFINNKIRIVVSEDGAETFSPSFLVNDNNHNGPDNASYSNPKIVFTQGRVNQATSGGQMVLSYNNNDTTTTSNPSIRTDVTTYTAVTAPITAEAHATTSLGITDASDATTAHTRFDTDYKIFVPAGTGITDLSRMSLRLALYHNNLSQLQIQLISPDGTRTLNLVNRGVDNSGNATNQGITGTGLGVVYENGNLQDDRFDIGTVFEDSAARSIRDATAASPFTGSFRPESSSFAAVFGGMTAADIENVAGWTVRVVDQRDDNITDPILAGQIRIRAASLHFAENVADNLGNDNFTGVGILNSNPTGTAHPTANAANPAGVGANVNLAVDNTLGSFSPYQGRIYAAFVRGGSVMVTYSDNGGTRWSPNPATIGAGFNPTITVDPTTGTVLVSYYSSTDDPTGRRVLTMLATSVNAPELEPNANVTPIGTMEFSTPAPVNPRDRVFDQIHSRNIDTEYVPSNGPNMGTEAYGNNMGLVSYSGNVSLVWAGNLNYPNFDINGNPIPRAEVRTQGLKISAGPRIVGADTGAILTTAEVDDEINNTTIQYNTPDPITGQARFTGFYVEFDRVVDPATFTPADIKIIYRTAGSDPTGNGTQITATSIQRLDEYIDPVDNTTDYGSKRFFVSVPPQVGAGTYSYVIGNLNGYELDRFGTTDAASVSDRIRSEAYTQVLQPLTAGDTYDSFINNVTIDDRVGATTTPVNNPIIVPTPPGNPTPVVGSVSVRISATHGRLEDLSFALTSPSGQTIPLMLANDATGINLTDTQFSDGGVDTIANTLQQAPYTGIFRPVTPFSIYNGSKLDGIWVLTALDSAQGVEGTLVNWSITVQRSELVAIPSNGNVMDQNANGLQNEANAQDVFSVPTAINNRPFILPYVAEAKPITVTGPRVISSRPVGQPQTDDNLVLNASSTSLDVEFDRTINSTTFTPADIIRMTGPLGELTLVGITVTPITAIGGTTTTGNSRFFRITYPTQSIPGQYQIQLSSDIADTNGTKMDPDTNAGVNILTGAVSGANTQDIAYPLTGSNPATPVSVPARGSASISLNINGANDAFLIQKALVSMSLSVPGGTLRDIEARLVSPDGSISVLLFQNAPTTGAASSFANVTFTDDSVSAIGAPITPATSGFSNGLFNNPVQPLAQLNNLLAKGIWTLSIRNKGAVPASVSQFGMTLTKPLLGSGVGDTIADQTSLGFRIFQADGSSDVAKNNWNPVGPDGQTTGDTTNGRVSNIQADPSDPSGNTVYAAGASGGLWRTTNFLTRDPAGPTWVPLTDFGSNQVIRDANGAIIRYGSAINIGSIALFNETGDPQQTKILVGTGSAALNVIDQQEDNNRYDGVGFLYSEDAGKTWQILDSRDNYNNTTQTYRPVTDAARDHSFVGTVVNKVMFEPKTVANSNLPIMYAAVGRGSTPAGDNMAGLWRSVNGGRTWVQLFQGEATDFAIGEGSARPNTNNRPTIGYLGIQGTGIFITNNLGTGVPVFNLMAGGVGRTQVNSGNVPTNAPTGLPNGAKSQIRLVTPKFIKGNALANVYYQDWLVAAVTNGGGHLDGLFVTKDRGANWTKLNLNTSKGFDDAINEIDNPAGPTHPFTNGEATHSLTLAMDPQDPNILYLGADRIMKIDMTLVVDPYKLQLNSHRDTTGLVNYLTSNANTDGNALNGGLDAVDLTRGLPPLDSTTPFGAGYDADLRDPRRRNWNFINLVRDPYTPFEANASLATTSVNSFVNSGIDVTWEYLDVARNLAGAGVTEAADDYDYVSNITTFVDPLSGRTRILWAHDEGVGTFVPSGVKVLSRVNGSLNRMDGFTQPGVNLTDDTNLQVEGVRNGNMQVARLYSGDAQPSLLAASISNSLFLAAARRRGDAYASDNNILANGENSYNDVNRTGRANYIAADPTGSGTVYILRRINDNTIPTTDFFQIQPNGGTPISRTNGLFQNSADSNGVGQWSNDTRRFSVNPIDGSSISMSSDAGRIFSTVNMGLNWFVAANPGDLDGSYVPAIAYGPPVVPVPGDPAPGLSDYIYAGTENGNIFVRTGNPLAPGWRDISTGLDGSQIQKIIPNPTRGTNSAYAVTEEGVYFMQDWTSTDPLQNTWRDVTGNLFGITRRALQLGANYETTMLQKLNTIAVDWRPLYATTPGTPILYAGGDNGVFRSLDGGTTWTRFTGTATGTKSDAGTLPAVKIVDLDLVLGNIVPGTGRTNSAGSPDMLVATTLGRGMWSLALGKPAGVSGPKVLPGSVLPAGPVNGTLSSVTVEFDSYMNITTVSPANIIITSPTGAVIPVTSVVNVSTLDPITNANPTNRFQINFAAQNTDGNYTITITPNVADGGGTRLNQNANSINGEQIVGTKLGDAYRFQVVVGNNDLADYVRDSYQALYNRQPTTAEYQSKIAALEKARLTGLSTVIREILSGYNPATKTYAPNSDTARRDLITRLFNNGGAAGEIGNFLPGYSSITAFVNTAIQRLRAGQTSPELLTVDILTLTDYATAASVQFPLLSANDAWLSKVYSDLFPGLGINPLTDFSPSVLASRRTQASTLAGRKALATSLVVSSASVVFDSDGVNVGSPVLTTTNYRTHFINLAYQKYLGRLPSTKELSAARSAMGLRAANNLQGSERVYALILSSQEFFNAQVQNEPLGGDVADNGSRTNRSWVEAVYDARVFSIAPDVNGFISTDTQRDYFSQKVLDTFKTARQTFVRSLPAAADVATGLKANRTNYRTEQVNKYYKLVHGNTRTVNDTEMASAAKFTALPNLIAARLASTEFASVITPPVGQQTMYTVTGVDPNTVTGTTAQKAATNANIWARAVYQLLFNVTLTSSDPAITFLAAAALRSRTSAALAVLNAVDGTTVPTKYKPTTGFGGTYRERLIQEYFQEYLGRPATGPFNTPTTEVAKYLTFLRTNTWQNFAADLLLTRDFYEIVD